MSYYPVELETLIIKVVSLYQKAACFDDLAQEARLALLLEYPKYDESRSSLNTWATHVIRRALSDYVGRERSIAIVPRNKGSLLRRMRKVISYIGEDNLREVIFNPATEKELPPHQLLSIEKDLVILRRYLTPDSSLWSLVNIDYSVSDDEELPCISNTPDIMAQNIDLYRALDKLTTQNKLIVQLHSQGVGLADIASVLVEEGITKVQITPQAVFKRLTRALKLLKEELQ